jgi:hypothetical protein
MLFVEHIGLPASMLPPNVAAFMGVQGGADERQAAADVLVRTEFLKLTASQLKEHLRTVGIQITVLPDDVATLAEMLVVADRAEKTHPLVLKQAASDAVMTELMKVPKKTLQEVLTSFGMSTARPDLPAKLAKADEEVAKLEQQLSCENTEAANTGAFAGPDSTDALARDLASKKEATEKLRTRVEKEEVASSDLAPEARRRLEKEWLIRRLQTARLDARVNRYATDGGLVTGFVQPLSVLLDDEEAQPAVAAMETEEAENAQLDPDDRVRLTLDETESTLLHPWHCFETVKQLDALMAYLNPDGPRERELLGRLKHMHEELSVAMRSNQATAKRRGLASSSLLRWKARADADHAAGDAMEVGEDENEAGKEEEENADKLAPASTTVDVDSGDIGKLLPVEMSTGTLRQQLIRRTESMAAEVIPVWTVPCHGCVTSFATALAPLFLGADKYQ